MSDIKRIIVSAFCQTAGLTATLQYFFPNATMMTAPVIGAIKDPEGFANALRSADAWINSEDGEAGEAVEFAKTLPNLKYLNVPLIGFHAFHPDMCGALNSSNGQFARQKYSSKIGVWAYRRGLTPSEAVQYFNERVFEALGYFDCWDESVAKLGDRFAKSDISDFFRPFYLRIKRSGQFMHTTTHPTAAALSLLGKIVAIKLGAPMHIFDDTTLIADSLAYLRWPVYPEIASNLSIPTTGYTWKMHQATLKEDLCIGGVEAFLNYCFAHYRHQNIEPKHIAISGVDLDEIDRRIAA